MEIQQPNDGVFQPTILKNPAASKAELEGWTGFSSRKLAQELIHQYFTTLHNPLTKHHLEGYNKFIREDMPSIIKAENPILLLKSPMNPDETIYKYKIEIYIGGQSGDELFVGLPTLSLQKGQDVRALFPNEARLRNLNYFLQVSANLHIKVYVREKVTQQDSELVPQIIEIPKFELCNLPCMLHSMYCHLYNKPKALLTAMGECTEDQGGYFILDGSEKVIVTRQEGAFNTLYVTEQKRDKKVSFYGTIVSIHPTSHITKRVSFMYGRELTRQSAYKKDMFGNEIKDKSLIVPSTLEVSIPFVRKPVPIFVLFRALGIQTDKEIMQQIFPDLEGSEAAYLGDLLIPSINAAYPILDTYSAIHYIKTLTKGFSEFHVLDILHNQLFPHVEEIGGFGSRIQFWGLVYGKCYAS